MQERRVRQGTHQRSLSPALRHLTYSSNNTRWWTQRMYPSTMPTSSLLSLFSIQFLSFRRTSPFHKAYRCLQPHPRTPILLTHTSPPPPSSTRCQRPRQARPLFSPKSLRSHHDRRHRPPPDDSVQENLNPLLERNLRTVACLIASSLFSDSLILSPALSEIPQKS